MEISVLNLLFAETTFDPILNLITAKIKVNVLKLFFL